MQKLKSPKFAVFRILVNEQMREINHFTRHWKEINWMLQNWGYNKYRILFIDAPLFCNELTTGENDLQNGQPPNLNFLDAQI